MITVAEKLIDKDSDGYSSDEDCNDNEASIYPVVMKTPNNDIDEDCDGSDLVDETLLDQDGDWFTQADGDCDDMDATVNPAANEVVDNGKDDDCNPETPDSSLDIDNDGDGVANFDEDQTQSDPTTTPGNTVPDIPVIEKATQTETVGLTPVLVTAADFDADNDDHDLSQWQISTESDFSNFILDDSSETQLTTYSVGSMVLETDTVYYWRVRFIDSRSGTSEWSENGTFVLVTAEESGDNDTNGILDSQEVTDTSADVNENGIPDIQEANIMILKTVEGQSMVGVETVSDNATLVSIKSIESGSIADQSVKLRVWTDWIPAIPEQ